MQNVLITGTGRPQALGFNLAKRYLEHGDRVFACVRKSTDSFAELLRKYPGELTVLVMDIADTPSVRAASEAVAAQVDRLDTIINNAVTTAPDCNAFVMEANPDNIAASVNVGASGPLRVIQAFFPLLKKSDMGLVVNISSEAGSIGACYRTNMTDYAVTKAALNMITKTIWNAWILFFMVIETFPCLTRGRGSESCARCIAFRPRTAVLETSCFFEGYDDDGFFIYFTQDDVWTFLYA